ncbi:MAG: deoxyribose-phosphate aldolase [Calditrichia bacterium]
MSHFDTDQISPDALAAMIDHTLLKAEATPQQVEKLCREARDYNFASVCINPVYVKTAVQQLKNSSVKVCTVVGFPLGASLSVLKALEAAHAIEEGAAEIDMVIHVGALKNADWEAAEQDVHQVVQVCHRLKGLCKVIIETALLSEEEKIRACRIVRDQGAEYVKTSTGFSSGGATAEDVALLHNTLSGSNVKVKASGGIRTFQDAVKMIRAGAERLGVSAGVQIIQQAEAESGRN